MLGEVIGDAGDEGGFGPGDEEVEVVGEGVLDEGREVRIGDGCDVLAFGDAVE
jgi:hypothetical protein